MKTLITLLLSCLPVLAADRAIVLSTSTNHVIAPTDYGLRLLTNANAGELLSLIGAVTETNVAQLNQSQTWTGPTNIFTGTIVSEQLNARPVCVFSTNIFTPTIVTNTAAGRLTNAGDYASAFATPLFQVTMPPLTNFYGQVCIGVTFVRTNVNAASANQYYYAGTNTNFVTYMGASLSTIGSTILTPTRIVFGNSGSTTNQYAGDISTVLYFPYVYHMVDTSVPWTLYVSQSTITMPYTNQIVAQFRVFYY